MTDPAPAEATGSSAPPPTRRSRWHRAAWALVLAAYPLLALGHLWRTDLERTDPGHLFVSAAVFVVRTAWFHLGLGLTLVAIWAAWGRHRGLVLATLAPVLVTIGPDLLRYLPRRPPPIAGPPCTIMHFNLLYANSRTAAAVAEIRRVNPDLLVLQEYDPQWDATLYPALAEDYPFVARHVRPGPFGSAVFSRLPFCGQADFLVPPGDARLPILRAEVLFGDQPVAVYGIHLWPPKGLDLFVAQRRRQLHLAELLAEETGPVIVCGDFNYTARHELHRVLLQLGLADAHEVAGWGRGSTWPMTAPGRFLPGFAIDHVYVGGGLTCGSARTGSAAGSDHKPVIVEVGFAADTP